jgi:ribokinase
MILVAGSANLDFVVQASHIPAPGETVLGRSFKTYPGGKGANQAVACARAAGAETHMLLALGEDAYALPLEASLREAGVQLHIMRSPGQATGTAFICVSDNGENAITVAPGANLALAPDDLPALQGFSHLLMQLETPVATVVSYASAARRAGVQVILNAAPAQALPRGLLALVDVLVVNEGELALVSGCGGTVAQCLDALQLPTVVVTLGARGCCARTGSTTLTQAAFAISPVDTTGAGDTFCGVLAAALGCGTALSGALRQANAAGALACTQAGAQSSVPTWQAVTDLLGSSTENTAERQLALRRYCGLS